ncbi:PLASMODESMATA CALLOSE-BINDING PROTEIN 5-like [Carica papaya]|uniref:PLASMODESMATA CALLOSE-BINDING PROTEIN 5-like n=1 Tax=Carica papaya TaxID=3649 RepID=UPI000B8CABA0|nr:PLASMODESMATA CALLOSE-BINDING PROTEIN 5-like [Carica papaya]
MFSVLSFWLFIFSLVSPQTVTAQNGVVVQTEVWCVAKNNAEDAALQGAIDWACGEGGADCGPIQKGGPCYDPTDIQTTASFAFNDYYLKHGLTDDACYFQNTAALTSLNPSHGNCKFPSSKTMSNGTISGSPTIIDMQPHTSDFSGCNHISSSWFWTWIIGVTITRTILLD